MMAESIGSQVETIQRRISGLDMPDSLYPALVFNPVLPGHSISLVTGSGDPDNLPAVSRALPGNTTAIAYASLAELSHWLQTRQITSRDLTRLYLDRLKQHDEELHCVVTLLEKHAMVQARAADRELDAGRSRGTASWDSVGCQGSAGHVWDPYDLGCRHPQDPGRETRRRGRGTTGPGRRRTGREAVPGRTGLRGYLVRRPNQQPVEYRGRVQRFQRRICCSNGCWAGRIRAGYRDLRFNHLSLVALRYRRAAPDLRPGPSRWCDGPVLVARQDRTDCPARG